MRWATALLLVAAVAAAVLPPSDAVTPLRVETPDETNGVAWRISGYAVDLGSPAATRVIAQAVAAKAELDVHAVSVTFPTTANLSGVPFLRVFAHVCTGRAATLRLAGAAGGATPATPQTAVRGQPGVTPAAAGAGTRGGYVTLYCVRVDPALRLTVEAPGGDGAAGADGGAGGAGVDGTPSVPVRCESRATGRLSVRCIITAGRMGNDRKN